MVHVETGRVWQNWMLVSIWVFIVENSLKAFTESLANFFLCVTRTLTSDIVPRGRIWKGQEELERCTRINTLTAEKSDGSRDMYHIIEDLLLCYSISLCMYIGLLLVAGHPSQLQWQVKANRDPLRNM